MGADCWPERWGHNFNQFECDIRDVADGEARIGAQKVAALGGWAEEASEKVLLSEAEQRLLDAAVDLSGNPQS